jgi:hypothetical protein
VILPPGSTASSNDRQENMTSLSSEKHVETEFFLQLRKEICRSRLFILKYEVIVLTKE